MSSNLIFDGRDKLKGKPGLHALIVGVSAYPHLPVHKGDAQKDQFGLVQLNATALTAYRVYDWLRRRRDRLPVPLASCRLLLSPQEEEIEMAKATDKVLAAALEADKEKLKNVLSASRNRFSSAASNFDVAANDWRDDARTHRDNMTLFYFAGHGAQDLNNDDIMLLEGFGSPDGPKLAHTVNSSHMIKGMAPWGAQKDIAHTQLYFIDACRSIPDWLQKYEHSESPDVFTDIPKGNFKDDRIVPIFYTTYPGESAWAIVGDQTIFGMALLQALDGAGAETGEEGTDEWCVTTASLNDALQQIIPRLNLSYGAKQTVSVLGLGQRVILHRLDEPPEVDVEFVIDPAGAVDFTHLTIVGEDDKDQKLPMPIQPHPYTTKLRAGDYTVIAKINPPTPSFQSRKKNYRAKPPRLRWVVRVRPK